MKLKQLISWVLLCGLMLSSFTVSTLANGLSVGGGSLVPTADDFYVERGASVRTEAPYGIRFTVHVSSTYKKMLEDAGYTVAFGALIAPTEKVEAATAFTKEALGSGNYVDSADKSFAWAAEDVDGKWQYRVALVGIPENWSSYALDFSGIGYLTLSKPGEADRTYYTAYRKADHSRSIADVACRAYEKGIDKTAVTSVLNAGKAYFTATKAKTVKSSPSTTQDIYENLTALSHKAYLTALVKDGYTLYTDHTLGNNVYSTFTKGTEIRTVLWMPNEDELRVMSETTATTSLPALKAGSYEKRYDSTALLQLGLNAQQGVFSGMGYVFRLHDGSFIVIDGGYSNHVGHNCDSGTTDSGNAEQLYAVLRHLAPDPQNITIAAWIFTHGHYDHLGAFVRFNELYGNSDTVTVEQFIYNRPTSDVCSSLATGDEDRWNRAETAIADNFSEAKTVTAHPGQIIYARNAKITMLFTHDLHAVCQNVADYDSSLYNAEAEGENLESDTSTVYRYSQYNNTSLIFTVEADGVKTLFPADASRDTGAILLALYDASVLKSDIMQVAHHGVQQTADNIYSTVAPTHVLWPLSTGERSKPLPGTDDFDFIQCVKATWRGGINSYFFENGTLKSTVYLANDDMNVLTLKNGTVTHTFYEDKAAFLASNVNTTAYGDIYLSAPQSWFE